MCGIAGVFDRAGAIHRSDIERMIGRLAHRGPDGQGISIECGIGLAHRRLAILDLSDAGSQPMDYLGRYRIVFNGEIYNWRVLRDELKRLGYRFHTETDTEVVMASYDRYGPDCLERFNGMWAFALHDRRENTFFLARDRFGIKPFYYRHDGRRFLFASEIKAILAHPAVSTRADLEYCRQFLSIGPREWIPQTAFEGIRRLPAAHWIRATADELATGSFQPRRYFTLDVNESDEPYSEGRGAEFAEEYRALLGDAVALRLRADVKVGSALSGGLDSSTIVRFANRKLREAGLPERQETFSCVYSALGTESCDESVHIDRLTNFLNVRSNRIEPPLPQLVKAYRKIVRAYDTPADGSHLSGWFTFALVGSTDVKVTLDGQGVDEQYGGYFPLLKYFLAVSRRPVGDYFDLPVINGSRRFARPGLLLGGVAMVAGRFLPRMLSRLAGRKRDPFEAFNRVLAREVETSLVNLLHYCDRVSMAHSIESRMPFMDYRLVRFSTALPASYKIHDGWTKHLCRKAMSGDLPDEIVWRRDKMGWPVPEETWFRGPLANWMRSEIERSDFLRSLGAGREFNRMLKGSKPVGALLRLLNLALWHKEFVDGSCQGTSRSSDPKTA